MATVYKIEFELTSHWVNYPPEILEKMLIELIENNMDAENPHNEIDVFDVEIEKK